jgi:hypothetical protein
MDEGYSPEGAQKQVDLEQEAEAQGKFRDFFRGGMRAALEGDFGSYFQSWLAEHATRGLEESLDQLSDMLWKLFSELDWGSLFGKGGGGGASGFMAGAGDFLAKYLPWGGGRAAGGPVMGGSVYRVGELGPENLIMPADGYVIPNGGFGDKGGESAGQVAVHVPFQIDARGATEDGVKLLNQKLDQIVRELPGTIVGVVNDGLSRRTIRTS